MLGERVPPKCGARAIARRMSGGSQMRGRQLRGLGAPIAAVVGLLVVAGGLASGPARAGDYTRAWGYPGLDNYCLAGNDLCVDACDYNIPGGYLLGKCYDHCYR